MIWLLAIPLALLVELLFRAVGHVGTEPLWWHDLATQRKELQMRRLGRADVVVIGTSMVLYGIDPDALGKRLGMRCYNASIYRGVPTVTEMWLRDFVLPMLRPRLVVIGLSAVEANDNSPLVSRYDEYRAAKVWSKSRARLWLVRRSYAFRFAPMAKHPRHLLGLVWKALRTPSAWRWTVPLDIPGKVGPLGEGTDMLDRSYAVMPRMGMLVTGQVGEGYDNGGVQSGAWRRMPDLVRSFGAEPVFVATPAPDLLFRDFYLGGYDAYLREQTRCIELARSTGTPYVDVTGDVRDERFFADPMHANRLGRDTFTALLADALLPYADHARGHADRDGVRRDLAAHDGVGTHDGPVADDRA